MSQSRQLHGRRGVRPLRAYLDRNVFADIDRGDSVEVVRPLLRRLNIMPLASTVNLIEAWRIEDPELRTRRIQVITGLGRGFLGMTSTMVMAQEVLTELKRVRPQWIKGYGSNAIERAIRENEHIWRGLKEDPNYYEPAAWSKAFVSWDVGRMKAKQQARRRSAQRGIALEWGFTDPQLARQLQPTIDAMPDAEKYWRYYSALTVWHGLKGSPSAYDFGTFLGSRIAFGSFSEADWAEVWLRRVDATGMTASRIFNLAEYHQWGCPARRGI